MTIPLEELKSIWSPQFIRHVTTTSRNIDQKITKPCN